MLGKAAYFEMYGQWPLNYAYGDFGVKILFGKDGGEEVDFTNDELSRFYAAKAPALFQELEEEYRKKLREKQNTARPSQQ